MHAHINVYIIIIYYTQTVCEIILNTIFIHDILKYTPNNIIYMDTIYSPPSPTEI